MIGLPSRVYKEIPLTTFMFADRIPAEILSWGDELARIRRDIHEHPELGFDTARTCGVITRTLAQWGVPFDAELVTGGVVAWVEGTRPGPTVALRADMDALAMPDESENPWRSGTPQRCHACGHDGHTTWLLGAVRALKARPDFPGRVLAVFQPAEEIGRGARSVLEAGVLEKFRPLEIYGAHASPAFPKGQIGIQAGPVQASCDFFYITLKGRGAHAARPHTTLDPLPTAALLTESLQTIVSRRIDPLEPAVLSICAVQAGNLHAPNVIPNELKLAGTIRTFSPQVRALVEAEMRRMSEGIALAQGLEAEVRVDHLTPPLINAPVCAEAAAAVARELFGPECPQPVPKSMAGEDFAEYANRIPGIQTYIGMADPRHQAAIHNPKFDFNDEILPEAVWFLSSVARSRLEALAQK